MKGNHLRGPLGTKELLTWHNLTMHDLANASYYNFQKHKNKYSTPDEGLNQTSIIDVDTRFTGKIPPFKLPVSISKSGSITDYDDIIDVEKNLARKPLNQQFPCKSGDWTSDGQAAFMHRLGWSPESKDVLAGRVRELIEDICESSCPALTSSAPSMAESAC